MSHERSRHTTAQAAATAEPAVRAPGVAEAPGQTPAARPAKRPLTPKEKQRRRERILSVVSPIAMILLWEFLSQTNILDRRFFPPPSGIVETFVEIITNGELARALGVSLARIFIGFMIGAVPGLLIGLTMGLFPVIRAIFEPVVAATYPIPKLALLPLIMILFGIGELSKYMTIAIGVFFLVLINTMAGVMNIDKIYLDVAKNYGAKRKDFYWTIALPGAMPLIVTGLKLGLGMALLLIVAAEMIAAKSGVGYMIWTGYRVFDLERMFVGLTIMAFLGYIFSIALDELERIIVPWKH